MAAAAMPARAALDPELKRPYRLQVVLQIADNRALTPLFQDELQRALGDQLRQTFGALARVEVKREHRLLSEIAARGLEQALDGWDETSDQQTHFVLLDYAGGLYRLQARGHDGMTGQSGPLVRRVQTGDAALVPLLAARLVEQGFSPVGTVTAAGKEVQLAFKGGGLGVPLDRWVKPGEVFAVSRIVPQGRGAGATRIAWALLEVLEAPRDGVCRCRYFHRFQEDDLHEAPGTLGFRAIKLPTTQGPVRLRLLDEDTYQPFDGMQVQVFRPGTKERVELTTNRDGLAITREVFDHLVIVRLQGVSLPIEIIEGRTAVCRIKVKGGSEKLAALEYRREAWLRRIYDDIRLVSDGTRELNQLLAQSLQAARDRAQAGLKNFDDELTHLTKEHGELKRLAQENKIPAGQFDLHDGEQRLAELREKRTKLNDFVQRVEEALKEGEQNAGLAQLLERARLLEAEADFAQAIALYERVVKASPEQTKIRSYLDQLKQGWALQGSKHAEARTFVYDVWPKIEVAGLQKGMEPARQALATLKAAGDRLTPRKMLQANAIHAANLKKEVDRLRQRDSVDNRSQAKVIAQVADSLRRLSEEITAFVGEHKE
jgi:hypothetical protein